MIDQAEFLKDFCKHLTAEEKGATAICTGGIGPKPNFRFYKYYSSLKPEDMLRLAKTTSEHMAFRAGISESHLEEDVSSGCIDSQETFPKFVKNKPEFQVHYLVLDFDAKTINEDLPSLSEKQKQDWLLNVYNSIFEPALPKTSIRYAINSGNGIHLYLVLENSISVTLSQYKSLYKKLLTDFRETFGLELDSSCSNPFRLFRLPYSKNSKSSVTNPSNVVPLYFNRDAFADQYIVGSLKHLPEKPPHQSIKKKTKAIHEQVPDKLLRRFLTSPGKRNTNCLYLSRTLLAKGYSRDACVNAIRKFQELVDSVEDPFPSEEAMGVFERQYSIHEHDPFQDNYPASNDQLSYADLADLFISETFEEEISLAFVLGKLHSYNGKHYEEIEEKFGLSSIMQFLQNRPELRQYSNTKAVREVWENLKAKYFVRTKYANRFWIDQNINVITIPLRSSLLLINFDEKVMKIETVGHTSKFFSLGHLEFDYCPEVKPREFLKVLNQILPNQEDQKVLQEFFGYLFINNHSFEKFLILYGKGGNGKGVIAVILECLIGTENISRVQLDFFNVKSYMLPDMVGKIVNFPTEMGQTNKASVGLLKAVVSGEPVMIEGKYKDPYSVIITAKQIFSTNELPALHDSSDATKRRMIVIHFKNNFSESKKRNPLLRDPDFWKKSNELPGIFNWALEGMARLLRRGHFKVPEHIEGFVDQFYRQLDPTKEFITDNLREENGSRLSPTLIFEAYKKFCSSKGIQPLHQNQLTNRIRDHFPNSIQDENPTSTKVYDQYVRDRKISGIRLLNELESLTNTHNTPSSIERQAVKKASNQGHLLPGFRDSER